MFLRVCLRVYTQTQLLVCVRMCTREHNNTRNTSFPHITVKNKCRMPKCSASTKINQHTDYIIIRGSLDGPFFAQHIQYPNSNILSFLPNISRIQLT
jgi:hypothetical protein